MQSYYHVGFTITVYTLCKYQSFGTDLWFHPCGGRTILTFHVFTNLHEFELNFIDFYRELSCEITTEARRHEITTRTSQAKDTPALNLLHPCQ